MPVERHTIRYARLFEFRVLHHYWLDEGATMFDALPDASQRERLQSYDVRTLLEIKPTAATAARLKGLQAVWKPTSLGLVVGLPADVRVEGTSTFEFTLRIVDPDFLAYTAYGLTVPASVDAYVTPTGRVLRFRSDAALYSNLTGCARGTGGAKQLFLSKEVPARQGTDRIEYIVKYLGALVQLLADPPSSATAVLGPVVGDLPAFATHADIPAVAALPGVVGALPSRGILLPDGAPTDTFALIRIDAVRATDPDFSCTVGGVAKPIAPVFQLRFKNRRTLWRRFRKSSPESLLSEAGPFPLTYIGNPSAAQKPVTLAVKLDRAATAITNIVSEIYT
jgi:hypothetical protein